MNNYDCIQDAVLASIEGGNMLLDAGENLATQGTTTMANSGSVSFGPNGMAVQNGAFIVGLFQAVAGGWMMIGGLIWEGIEAVVDTP